MRIVVACYASGMCSPIAQQTGARWCTLFFNLGDQQFAQSKHTHAAWRTAIQNEAVVRSLKTA